jgi:hypothetical protein
MARKRMVSPELLTSLPVASMPINTRYAFVALWMYLDDAGRGKDNPALIRAHTWPLDPVYKLWKVTADLDLMITNGLLCRYVINNQSYLHSPSWFEHQSINRPTPSKFPPCPVHEPDGGPAPHGALTEPSLNTHGGLSGNRSKEKRREVKTGSREPSLSLNGSGGPCEHGASRPGLCAICRRELAEQMSL